MNKETIIDVIIVFVVSVVVYKIGMWMEVSKDISFAVATLTGVYFGIRSLRR